MVSGVRIFLSLDDFLKETVDAAAIFSMERDDSKDQSSLRTRETLIARLRSKDDSKSWEEFYDLYEKLIRGFARKCGLSREESDEVVQETMVTIANMLEGFEYDRKRCSFRGWIFHKTRWRIADQIRKRPFEQKFERSGRKRKGMDYLETTPDPNADVLSDQWIAEWRNDVAQRAVDRVKRRVNPRQFQIFDLYVIKGWSVKQVKEALNVSSLQVYLAKHRISRMLQKEVSKLELEFG